MMHGTLSHLQFPHGDPSTTSQRTLRARQLTQASTARRLVALETLEVDSGPGAPGPFPELLVPVGAKPEAARTGAGVMG